MINIVDCELKNQGLVSAKLSVSSVQILDSNSSVEKIAVIDPTPTCNTLTQRLGDFDTLISALEYAADGVTGYNFYDAKGRIRSTLPYKVLKHNARNLARHLLGIGLVNGDRVGIIGDTTPEFLEIFFACRYAGLIPFAMSVPVNLGSHAVYVRQLHGILKGSQASATLSSSDYIHFLEEAARDLRNLKWVGTPERLRKLPAPETVLHLSQPDEVAYLQFTSGSTRAPRGVVITERALMSNLQGIVQNGVEMRSGDRCASWLPFYHDMGLVGMVMAPMVTQVSVDYLATRDFAIRPLQWLRLISRNRCTMAFSQPFGLKLCTLRVRDSDLEDLDLSAWRTAGIGAEMIRPDILRNFAEKFRLAGFNSNAFLPCYGLAESTLAVTFAQKDSGFQSLRVDARMLADQRVALPLKTDGEKYNEFVNCGKPLPGHLIKIVNDIDQELPDSRVGSVLIHGASIMAGYFNDSEETKKALLPGGWLDTGDLGFILEGSLYITGRRTDIIIVNGRNIRAQDVEELAEQQPEIRAREASAFSVIGPQDNTIIVLVVECRLTVEIDRQSLINRLQRMVYMAFGVNCLVELIPPHTLPRTSSGKLSRSSTRQGFLLRANLRDQPSVESREK